MKNLFISWRFLSIAAALMLSACSTIPNTPHATADQTAVKRTYAEHIAMSGRLSIFYEKNSEKKAAHGSFSWDQSPDITRIALFSPLGQTIAKITLTPSQATLEQADKAPVEADDVDLLTETVLGWPLPVEGLRDWLQGFGTDAQMHPFIASPENQQTITTDSDWSLSYLRWGQNASGRWYPQRINLNRHSEEAGEIIIRIVVDDAKTK